MDLTSSSTLNPLSGLLPFDLKGLEGFPYTTYLQQKEAYDLLEDWYDGTQLSSTVVDESSGDKVEKYPVKINPLPGTCQKHVGVLFGQNIESIKLGGIPVQFVPDSSDLTDEESKTMRDELMHAYEASQAGALFVTSAIQSQYLGGCVFKLSWRPDLGRIKIENPEASEFVGIPDGKDYWDLREGWIVRQITKDEAKSYGYKPKLNENNFWYIEHWTRSKYKIMVNGQVVNIGESDQKAEGANPFGFVPMVYIPHMRVSGFLGDPIISEAAKGIIREMNLRFADMGDGISEDSHVLTAMRNVRGTAKPVDIAGRTVIDLGSTHGLSPNETPPDLFAVKTQSVSEPMIKFTQELEVLYRREVNHPAVADGEDEGSQRSSLTLTTRMWPLVNEAEFERVFWSIGLTILSKMLMSMSILKGVGNFTQKMLDADFIVQWQPMLPRDRESLVQEAVMRESANLASNTHLMQLFGDIQDPEAELKQIQDQNKKLSESEQTANAFSAPGGSSNLAQKTKANNTVSGANIKKES